ncbi:hypothetical protein BT96DRAFT_971295 [Gymnopus androsaceus JB14]|uniref:Uncharacterized protein n=1 Tax=Gymnopus androsaceus JB14 TaxID=1447944 RepID=A0A6A4IEQ2_9AGAR|nr:hypothetical protein BT96DRAFT_971295 [Gymnopus androsaceus JB14]
METIPATFVMKERCYNSPAKAKFDASAANLGSTKRALQDTATETCTPGTPSASAGSSSGCGSGSVGEEVVTEPLAWFGGYGPGWMGVFLLFWFGFWRQEIPLLKAHKSDG